MSAVTALLTAGGPVIQASGAADQAKGSAQNAASQAQGATGSASGQAQGAIGSAQGSAQDAAGKVAICPSANEALHT